MGIPLNVIASERPTSSVSQLAARALEIRITHAVRAVGLAPALLSHRLAERGRRVLHVTPDLESATRAQADLRFLRGAPELGPEALRTVGEALLFAPPEGDAYAEVHQDRRAAMSRCATWRGSAAARGPRCVCRRARWCARPSLQT